MDKPLTEHPDFTIRTYQRDDLVDVVSLLDRHDMWHPERDGPLLSFGHGDRLIATLGQSVIGHVYAGDRNGIPVVGGLVVDEAYRKHGVGESLMSALQYYLAAQGRRTIELQVDEDKPELLAWYERLGFTPTYACVGLVKELSPPAGRDPATLAFKEMHLKTGARYIYTHSSEAVSELMSAMEHAGDSSVSLGSTKIRQELQGESVLFATPWCMSVAHKEEMVRWAKVPLINAKFELMREIRSPLAARPATDPLGKAVEPYGNYLFSCAPEWRVIGFMVAPDKTAATLLDGTAMATVLKDLQYAQYAARIG
jgi:GNAT superfamily N-acetyltransferase